MDFEFAARHYSKGRYLHVVCRSADADEWAQIRNLIQQLPPVKANSRLELQTARIVRILSSCGRLFILVPLHSSPHHAAKTVADRGKEPQAHEQRLDGLCKGLSREPKVDSEDRAVLSGHAETCPDSTKLDFDDVQECVVWQNHDDAELFKVQLRVLSRLHQVAVAIRQALVTHGGTIYFGGAFHTWSERIAEDLLAQL